MSLCNDQTTFNSAVKKALDSYTTNDDTKSGKIAPIVLAVIYIVFLIWALILAMKVEDRDHKTLHIFFAITAPPLYVLSHYL